MNTESTLQQAISCAHGRIDSLLLAFPKYDKTMFATQRLLRDLIRKMHHYTRLQILAYDDEQTISMVKKILEEEVASYFFYDEQIGKNSFVQEFEQHKCCIIKNPLEENFSIWIQDPFIVVSDKANNNNSLLLIEPYQDISGTYDDNIANNFEQLGLYQAKNVPLAFHGGNLMVADDFILVGASHYNTTKRLIASKLRTNSCYKDLDKLTQYHFSRFLGRNMKIIPVGNTRYEDCSETNIPEELHALREPFAHIDLYITLAGRNAKGQYQLLVADPVAANPDDQFLIDSIKIQVEPVVKDLRKKGFDVIRNPMPLTRTQVDKGNTYYCPYNNCLVEIDELGKRVWMPTFGHGKWQEQLRKYDIKNREIWHNLGFEVNELMNFHSFVRDKAGVRCVTKYMGRFSLYSIHNFS